MSNYDPLEDAEYFEEAAQWAEQCLKSGPPESREYWQDRVRTYKRMAKARRKLT